MTLVNWLIIVAGVFLIGYIVVRVYTRWCSMADELRYLRVDMNWLEESIADKHQLLRQKAEKIELDHDSIWKSIRELKESIERLKKWQISINDIFINREPQEQKEQQIPYHQTHKRATRRRKL